MTEERENDQQIEHELDDLNGALQQRDADKIRACTMRVVARVRAAVGQRRSREERQLKILAERLQSLSTELNVARELATIDPLTQLYNRGAFDEQLARLGELGFFYGLPPVLMLLDIDHFKAINDRLGHPAGDQVLRQVADTLVRTFLRKQDFVCRYGGEEFGILVLETTEDGPRRASD